MKTILLAFTLLCISVDASGEPEDDDPDGSEILNRVVAALPRDRLEVSGELTVRLRRGVETVRHTFDMVLDWGASSPRAVYTISDAFGSPLSGMRIEWPTQGGPQTSFFTGPSLQPDTQGKGNEQIEGTDLTWTDLSLSWLWWSGAVFTGRDTVRGRDCYVVEVPFPSALNGSPAAEPKPDHVRIWVDTEIAMVLKAEGRDDGGAPLRTMWVKSFKKVDGHWMIKDLEVQSYPVTRRTRLRVREVRGIS